MTIRRRVGRAVETVAGRDNLKRLRKSEARTRRRLAAWIDMPADARPPAPAKATDRQARPKPAKKAQRPAVAGARPAQFQPSDPFVPHPKPSMTRHQFLVGLHECVKPRTYLEIGIRDGASLALARCRSIGVDPAYRIVKELEADLRLVRLTSDEFFERDDAFAHFKGLPTDLAFIDGMHLSEFAFRDFVNVEKFMSTGGIVVLDDILPRNPLEAARIRKTDYWAGDVYKAVDVLRRRRPDLLVVLVNTAPTGTAIVARVDPETTTNLDIYQSELPTFLAEDPQAPPLEYMDRSSAVDPRRILSSAVWDELVRARDDAGDLTPVWARLAELQNAPSGDDQPEPTADALT